MTAREYFSPAGKLITKAEAPVCVVCGRALWTPVWKCKASDDDLGMKWPTHNEAGERLGYMPRLAKGKEPRCFQRIWCWMKAHPEATWYDAQEALAAEAEAK